MHTATEVTQEARKNGLHTTWFCVYKVQDDRNKLGVRNMEEKSPFGRKVSLMIRRGSFSLWLCSLFVSGRVTLVYSGCDNHKDVHLGFERSLYVSIFIILKSIF